MYFDFKSLSITLKPIHPRLNLNTMQLWRTLLALWDGMFFKVDELKTWVVVLETAACRDIREVGKIIRAIDRDNENEEAKKIVNDLARE